MYSYSAMSCAGGRGCGLLPVEATAVSVTTGQPSLERITRTTSMSVVLGDILVLERLSRSKTIIFVEPDTPDRIRDANDD